MDDVEVFHHPFLNSGFFIATTVFGLRRYYIIRQQKDNIYCEKYLTWYVTHSELQIFIHLGKNPNCRSWTIWILIFINKRPSRYSRKVLLNILNIGKTYRKFSYVGNYYPYPCSELFLHYYILYTCKILTSK